MVVCVFPCLKNFKIFFKISIRGVTTLKHSSTKVIPSIMVPSFRSAFTCLEPFNQKLKRARLHHNNAEHFVLVVIQL